MDSINTVLYFLFRTYLGEDYKLIKSEDLSAINLSIFIHSSIFDKVTSNLNILLDINSDVVKTGIGNMVGNKGGIGISFNIEDKSFIFINSHLAGSNI